MRELAEGDGVKPSYAAGMLRLTLLAPAIVEAVLDGRQAGRMSLVAVIVSLPLEWKKQGGVIELRARCQHSQPG